jgi:hypothetical protein
MAAGQNESRQRRKAGVKPVDTAFKSYGSLRIEGRQQGGSRSTGSGGEPGADGKQLRLDSLKLLSEVVAIRWQAGDQGADDRIELVQIAVGLDAFAVLRDPFAAEEAGFTPISAARIDLHSFSGWL